MKFVEAFGIEPKSVVAIVGAGGKTTLLYQLARELAPEAAKAGGVVLITTTTKIFQPGEEDTEAVIVSADLEEARKRIRKAARKDMRVVLATGSHPDPRYDREKLDGIPPDWAGALLEMDEVAWLLVEADGSQRKPLKAPGEGEPVWPQSTNLAIGVLGLSALGRPLTRDWVFRPERVAAVAGCSEGEVITPEVFASLLSEPEGIFRNRPDSARIIGFLNQAEDSDQLVGCDQIGYIIKNKGLCRIQSLFAGSLHAGKVHRVWEYGE